jgi:lipopolysaccharide/colanic/teichoic acid biosynthesis glycosyltransferase
MVTNADRIGDPTFTGKADSRVTRVGKLLRAAHVDELPQFINILSGEMSLVGPRPERYVKELEEQIPFYRMRLAVRPGTAGWALVKQGYAEGKEGTLLKLQYDLFYIKHMSFYLDMVIIIRTAIDMLFRRGQ